MDRKFVIALSSLAGSMMLTEAHAIGLGEIKLHSSLNEPLRADIRLVQVKDLGENEILVSLAPQADFARAKVDRDFLLTSLRFRLDLDNPNDPKVVVTTQQPIREPFLNFLVEVQWPSGRLLREYTLLMDLPAFAESKAASGNRNTKAATVTPEPSMPEASPVSESRAKPSAPRTGATSSTSRSESSPVREPRDSGVSDGTYGPTRSNDTLWRIAQNLRNGGSVHQNMLAIQKLNPGAFSKGNINQLKKGQVLKLPTREEVSSISRAEAIAQVDEQNKAWKARGKSSDSAAVQVDATGRTQETASPSTQPDGQLKLAAPTTDTPSQAAQGSGETTPAVEVDTLKNNLAAKQEELDRVQRENDQNAAKAKELDSQINNAERLLELQNSEMAAMQARLAAEQQAKADAAATDGQAAAEPPVGEHAAPEVGVAQATAPEVAAQEGASVAPSEEQVAAPQSEAESATEAQPPASETAGESAAETPPPPAEKPVIAAPEKKTPVPATQAESSDNTFIGGIIAVILVLLGLFGYRRMASRDAHDEEKELEADSLVSYESEPASYTETESHVEQPDEFDVISDMDVSAVVEPSTAESPVEPAQPETGDVLGEADIYISFGNFEKAESILKPAIEAEPRRADLQLKLLELYKEMGNLTAFDQAYGRLAALGAEGSSARARDLRSRIPGADSVPLPVDEASALVSGSALDEDFDLGFDDVLSSESAPQSEMQTPAEEVGAAAAVGDAADFNLDLDLEADFTPPSDLEPSAEVAVADVALEEPAPAAGEFSLDFDLDLDLDLTSPVEAPVSQIEETVGQSPVQEQPAVTTDAGGGAEDDDLGFISNADEAATKLDLARAYIDMGDKEGARDILAEVIEEGQDEQKREAQALLDSIG